MKNLTEKQRQFLIALDAFFNDTEEEENIEEEYNKMLIDLNKNKELKQLVYRLVDKKDQEDAWQEIIIQVATIKDKATVLRLWNKKTKEYHWFMVRVICNQLKSKTSQFYRQYRRVNNNIDDNSNTIMDMTNDIGQDGIMADGYVLDSIQEHLTHNDDTEHVMDEDMIMAEVNWFVTNHLTFYERELYKLYYEEELSHVKISNATRIPATSIGNTVRKVLSMIQDHLISRGIITKDKDNNI